jgi:hypothetical protein
MMEAAARAGFLSPLIGQPWAWQTRNCWDFAGHVEGQLFGRRLPHIAVPDEPSWRWMLQTVGGHPEHENWREVAEGPHGLIRAADGALCLMGRNEGPGHIGVWLKPEQAVIHCDRKNGVCFQSPAALKQQGWRKLRYFEPKEAQCSSS